MGNPSKRIVTLALGVVLIAAGVRGLTNLSGAMGDMIWVLQAFAGTAVFVGLGLSVGSLLPFEAFYRLISYVVGVASAVIFVVGVYTASIGVTATGELAPFFLTLGVLGVLVSVVGGGFVWKLTTTSQSQS